MAKKIKCLWSMLILSLVLFGIFEGNAEASTTETQDDYEYIVNEENNAVIVAYNGDEVDVTIPSTIGGYKTYEVAVNAFLNNDTVKTITISEGIERIGWYCFAECDSLQIVRLPESIKYVGNYAFENCLSLERILVEEGNSEYATFDDALYNKALTHLLACPNKAVLELADSVTLIEDRVFIYCTKLKNITVPNSNEYFKSQDGAIYTADATTLLQIAGGVEEIELLNSVTKISDSAAFGNSSVVSIVLPEGLKEIEAFAFRDCIRLKNITLPSTLESLGEGAFYQCIELEEIVIPEQIKVVPSWTFCGCEKLERVVLSPKTEEIELAAFASCLKLRNINFSNTLRKIGVQAFSVCNELTEITIPEGVVTIGEAAFQFCDRIKTITIPSTVEEIGSAAFQGTMSLEEIIVSEANNHYKTIDNVLYNKDGTILLRCPSTKEYFIVPSEVKELARGAFSDCLYLRDIYIPENVEKIGDACFNHNFFMNYVTVMNKDTVWGEGVFNECYAIILCSYNESTNSEYALEAGVTFQDIETHEHVYRVMDIENATCKTEGYRAETCKICLERNTITLEKLDHDYNSEVAAPTCTTKGYTTHTCKHCEDSYTDTEVEATGHDFDSWKQTQAPTCTKVGSQKHECKNCDKVETKTVKKLGHKYATTYTTDKEATCKEAGSKSKHCIRDGCSAKTSVTAIAKKAHTYKKNITKATLTKNGKKSSKCTKCGYVALKTSTIYSPKTIKLSTTKYTYNGKVRQPSVTIKDSKGNTLKKGTDYTLNYSKGCKNPGQYTVTVTFKGAYAGTKQLTYTIKPKAVALSKLTERKKGFNATWEKGEKITGYEIQYSTSSKFTKKTTDTVRVSNAKTTSKSISKLTAKKKYYVRVRTYKTEKVNGKSTKIYSDWSKVKSVMTKK